MKETIKKKAKEGKNLFGSPTFVDLGNGPLRSVETGEEVLAGDAGSYTCNKRYRLGLIDYALSQGKSPINMFSQVIVFNFLLVISERREKALTTVKQWLSLEHCSISATLIIHNSSTLCPCKCVSSEDSHCDLRFHFYRSDRDSYVVVS